MAGLVDLAHLLLGLMFSYLTMPGTLSNLVSIPARGFYGCGGDDDGGDAFSALTYNSG